MYVIENDFSLTIATTTYFTTEFEHDFEYNKFVPFHCNFFDFDCDNDPGSCVGLLSINLQ